MKVAVWANSPSPHQSDFYAALRQRGVDLHALYRGHLAESRLNLGWREPGELPEGEIFLPQERCPLDALADWRERIHIIPGYSRRVHRQLVARLSRAGVPWVHWSESSSPVWRAHLTWIVKRWYAGMVNRRALGAFAQGAMAEKDFRRWGITQTKIRDLYYAVNGVTASATDPIVAKFVGTKPAFVFVGSLCHRKACDVLLKAFALVCREATQPVLVLVGDGPRGMMLRRMTHRLGIDDRVLFRGVVPMPRIGSVLVCCQTLVLPSRFDGWGMVLNEGASAGLALIATDRVGAAHHLIEPGWNGAIARAGEVASLATAMHEHIKDPTLAVVRGHRSRELCQRFTPEANASRFLTSIREWLAADSRWSSWPGYAAWYDHAPGFHKSAAA